MDDMDDVTMAADAEMCRRSFSTFVEHSFPISEMVVPFRPARHLQVICDHLEAVARGQIKKLMISIPPGHGCSTLAMTLTPWIWTWDPGRRAIHASGHAAIAARDSTKAHRIVDSNWYRGRFSGPQGWRSDDDRSNSKGGNRAPVAAGDPVPGEAAHLLVADNLQNATTVQSQAEREQTNTWWFERMALRVNDPSNSAFIIMQTRLHPDDLVGEALARDLGYEYLCLPTEFEPDRRSPADWRATKGELLHPEKFSADDVARTKKWLGAVQYAAQHQQNPTRR